MRVVGRHVWSTLHGSLIRVYYIAIIAALRGTIHTFPEIYAWVMQEFGQPVYTLTGDLEADGKKVTISGVETVSTPIPDLARQEALEILEGDTKFDYTLEADSLTISSPSIPVLLQVKLTDTSLTFTESS